MTSSIEVDGLSTVTAPANEPVSLADLKNHLRVSSTHEDSLITTYGIAARQGVERWTSRALINQTLRLHLQKFPRGGAIRFPRSPVSASSSNVTVKYYTDDGSTAATFASTNYFIDATHEPGRIQLKRSVSWPNEALRSRNPVEVDFVAGYGAGSTGASSTDVPAGLRVAVMEWTSNLFENREPIIVGTIALKIPFTVETLLESYTVDWFS